MPPVYIAFVYVGYIHVQVRMRLALIESLSQDRQAGTLQMRRDTKNEQLLASGLLLRLPSSLHVSIRHDNYSHTNRRLEGSDLLKNDRPSQEPNFHNTP